MTGLMDMDRRSILRSAMLLAGAGLAADGTTLIAGEGRKKAFRLDASRFATVTALADTLLPKTDTPGAVELGVPRQFEAMMRNWASGTRQTEISAAIDRIAALGKAEHGKPFAQLPPAAREAVLKPFDAAALKTVPPKPGESVSLFSGPSLTDPAYGKMRQLLIALYLYSEPVQTQVFDYHHVPGRFDGSVPITPQTRPEGGTTFL